jgi:hypothetical protein
MSLDLPPFSQLLRYPARFLASASVGEAINQWRPQMGSGLVSLLMELE